MWLQIVCLWHFVLGWLTGSLFLHFKGGKYRLLYIAEDCTNYRANQPVVVYISLTTGEVYTRTLEEWNERVPGKGRRFKGI